MAAFHLVSIAAGGPPPPLPRPVQIGNLKVRLNGEDPQVRSLMAFSTSFLDAGGSDHFLPNNAAMERYFAFLKFLRSEKVGGGIAFWPESLLLYDENGDVALSNDLIMAAAIANLDWGRPFRRDHLLTMAIHGTSE